MMAVTGIIVIVLVVILAVAGGSGAAKSATVADAVAGKYADQKIQVILFFNNHRKSHC